MVFIGKFLRVQGEAENGTALGAVFGGDGAAVGPDNGGAYGKANAGIAFLTVRRGFFRAEIAVEKVTQSVGADAAAIVRNGEGGFGSGNGHIQLQPGHALAVADGVFQQIDQHLLHKDRIHGDHNDFLRDGQMHLLPGA